MYFYDFYRRQQRDVSGEGSKTTKMEFIDKETPVANDGRSQTRTTFRYEDAPQGKQEQYRRLAKINDGMHDSSRPIENWRVGKENDVDLFANHLSLSDVEHMELREMASDIDFNKFGTYTVGQVLVSLCSLISDKHTTVFDNRIILKEEFQELLEVNNMGSREHRRIRQLIREKTDHF